MFEIAFSLEGRLGRLPFFLGGLALTAIVVAGLLAIVAGAAFVGPSRSAGALFGLVFCLLFIGAALFCSLSLHVRRIRDIGWDPMIVVSGWLFANVVDTLVVAQVLPMLARPQSWHGTYVGTLANVALSLSILFWPSQDDVVSVPPQSLGLTLPPIPPAPRLAVARRGFGRRL